MAYINASGQVLNVLNLTKKLNRITNKNLGKDAKAGYKEYEVELPPVETQEDDASEVNLEDNDADLAEEDEGMESLNDEEPKKDL